MTWSHTRDGDGGVLVGVFDSGVAHGFHHELVRFSHGFLSQFSACVGQCLSQFSLTVSGLWCPIFVDESPILESAEYCSDFRERGIFQVRQFSLFSAAQAAPIFE